MECDHFPGVIWKKKNVATELQNVAFLPNSPSPARQEGISWKVGQSQVLVAISERVLGAAGSLLEGFPLAPEAREREMFPWKSAPQSWQAELKGLERFAPQLHVYGQCGTPPVITTCGLGRAAVN